MNSCICLKKFSLPEVNFREVRRYMHAPDAEDVNLLISHCAELSRSVIDPGVCFGMFDVEIKEYIVNADNFCFDSSDLSVCLKNCDKIVMFCATIGFGLDRLIHKFSVTDKAKAVCLHALGAERIEALCDIFCEKLSESFNETEFCITPRFSPGYGDFDICSQKIFFEQLDINKHLGVSLSDSFLMSPSKTVTAVLGIKHM